MIRSHKNKFKLSVSFKIKLEYLNICVDIFPQNNILCIVMLNNNNNNNNMIQ